MSILNLVPSLRANQSWTQILADAIRPEFAPDVFLASPDNPVLWPATCTVQTCSAPVRHHQMCAQHVARWNKAGRPPQGTWMATQEALPVTRVREVRPCALSTCSRSAVAQVCRRHEAIRRAHFGNDLDRMLRELVEEDEFADRTPVPCYVPWCDFPVAPRAVASTDPETRLCDGHFARYSTRLGHLRRTGRAPITIDEFVFTTQDNPLPKFKTTGLAEGLSLEVKYGLQARSDGRGSQWRADQHNAFITSLRATGLTTLTGDETDLVTALRRVGATTVSVGFARSARAALVVLRDFGADPYARDVWDLDELGVDRIARDDIRRLDFTGIHPEWLRDLAKRWSKHRLDTSRVATVSGNVRALTKMCAILADQNCLPTRPEDFTRSTVDAYILAVRRSGYSRNYRARLLSTPRMFLDHVARHRWEPRLPDSTRLYNDDVPKPGQTLPRAISDFVMAQMESPDALNRVSSFEAGTILRVLIECGLRGASVRRLEIDALTRDGKGAPFLRYLNTKFDREAVIPISEPLAARIQEQAARTLARWPATPWLMPRTYQNVDGLLPYAKGAWKQQFASWLATIGPVDEMGRAVRVTPHQFRHTVATRMVNLRIPLDVVRTYLDHSSVTMTEVYARLYPNVVLGETRQYVDRLGNTFQPDPLTDSGPLPRAVIEQSRTVIDALYDADGAVLDDDC